LRKRILLALLLSVCLVAAGWVSFQADRAAVPDQIQDLTDHALLITEICTKNETVLADNDGKYRDYIELYNPGQAVDLTGCRLTDGKITSAPLRGLYIPTGGYRIIFLADALTGFGLSASGGDCIQLLDPSGHILYQTNTTALAKDQVMLYRDGTYQVSDTPSPGFANDAAGAAAFASGTQAADPSLVISELLVQNVTSLPDENGVFGDVLELYNPSGEAVYLGGYCLSDSLEFRFRYRLPDVWLQPGSYLVVFCDSGNYVNQNGQIHTNFALSAGEQLVLTAPNGSYVAWELTYPGDDISVCLLPDGSYRNGDVSLGFANDAEGQLLFAQSRREKAPALVISEVLLSASGVPYDGMLNDVVELQNISDKTVTTEGWFLSDGKDPYAYPLPPQKLKPGACMVVVCGEQTTGFSLSKRETVRLMTPEFLYAPEVSCALAQPGFSITRAEESYTCMQPSVGFANTGEGQAEFLRSQLPAGLQISEVMTSNGSYLRGPYATTCDWVELYNGSGQPIDLSDYRLSDTAEALGTYVLPEITLAAGEYVVLFLAEDTRNLNKDYAVLPFALSAAGDSLYLSRQGVVEDYVFLPEMERDAAYGRFEGTWQLLDKPTPEKENAAPAALCAAPLAVTAQGVYNDVDYVDVVLSGEGTIYYTTDARAPSLRSKVYAGPIRIKKTTVIRAFCVAPGKKRSDVVDLTYVVNEKDTLPVVTIVSDPENFFSSKTGIYVFGEHYEPEEPYRGANFWQDWEREATVSLFEKDGTGFTAPCGVTIYGAYSRYQPKKSLALHFRGIYGASELEYPVFGEEGVATYEALVLRAGGQDSYRARIRDELITSLAAEHTDLLVQKYRPAVLYINGEYYGLHFIREKINEHFVAANCNVPAEDVILGRGNASDVDAYQELVDYAATHDLSDPDHYAEIGTMMDIDQYMDYIIAQICIGNDDNSNVRFFTTKGGRWRWILYDTDLSLYNPQYNSVEEHLNPWGTGAGNYISTELITSLLENPQFRDAFLRRIAWQMDTIWTPENVHSRIDAMLEQITPDVRKDMIRWDDPAKNWDRFLEILRNYVDTRYEILVPQIQAFFELTDAEMRGYGFRV